MKINAANITLAVVVLHGLAAVLKALFHTPAKSAQIDAIEAKVDTLANVYAQTLGA